MHPDTLEPGLGSEAVKLRVFSSPLLIRKADDESDNEHDNLYHEQNFRNNPRRDDYPEFKRYEEPTLLEIFYDLFFAATYNTFCDTKPVINHGTFKASIGFFCLLWLTWLSVTFFDVRYATDSIFSRLTTALQLGVLVGFVVVAPKWDPEQQVQAIMRSMSLILAVSRFVLVVQYSWLLWHVRHFKKARWPLYCETAVHFVAAVVCLGITFRFTEGGNSRVFMTWYFVSGAEAVLSLVLSLHSPVVALSPTHLMKRMALLTVMILGEGIESMAKKVIVIVNNPNAWDAETIGHVTAAAATIYFVFLVYFDWLGPNSHLTPLRQIFWTIIHLPFHLALVLFMQGFTQLLIWGKIASQINRALFIANPADDIALATGDSISAAVGKSLNQSVQGLFADFPPKISSSYDIVNSAITNITKAPDAVWGIVSLYDTNPGAMANATAALSPELQESVASVWEGIFSLAATMTNTIFTAFGVDLQGEIVSKFSKEAGKKPEGGSLQLALYDKNWSRYGLVFAYTYVAAGITILFVVLIRLLSTKVPRQLWAILRLVLVVMLAFGTSLTAILFFNKDKRDEFLEKPWVSPTIALVWTTIVVLTHIHGGGIKLAINMFRRRRERKGSQERLTAE